MDVPRAYDELVGSVIDGKYRLDRCIGAGGMGSVYEGLHLAIGKRVALKFLEPSAARDQDAVLRFQREAKAASAVESAHIVQIFDSGATDSGRPYLVMELLRGEDLRARLRREGRLPEAEAARIARQVLRALARAHRADIVHRDLKPDNVFLCERDDDGTFVKIVDFGISKIVRRAEPEVVTTKGTVLGTVFYMSPEQAQGLGDVDGRADLYSVGAILFECLAGRPPYEGPSYESVLVSICTEDAPSVRSFAPDVSAELSSVIERALARDRDARYQTADEFIAALDAAVPGTTSAVPVTAGRRSRRHVPWVAAIVAALAAFAVTAVLLRPRAPATPAIPPAPIVNAVPEAASAAASAPPPEPVSPPSTAPAKSASTPPAPTASARKVRAAAPPVRPPASAQPQTPKRKGVAAGLELSLEEP